MIAIYSLDAQFVVVTAYGYAEFPTVRAATEFIEQLRAACALVAFARNLMRRQRDDRP